MTGDAQPPAQLRRLWGLSTPARRGRPAELDGQRVVAAAIELADEAGLSAVTLSQLAERLGYSPMSLYRHMGSMDELLELMVDAAGADIPAIDAAPADWRAGLRAWAVSLLRLAHRHPWLHQVPITGPPAGPNQLAWMERGLAILRVTALDWPQKVGALMLISGYVRNFALQTQSMRARREDTGLDQSQAEARWAMHLARLIDAERFPETARLMASGTFDEAPAEPVQHPEQDPDFDFGLECVLDGVAVSVAEAPRR